jgi:Cu-processing system ATP-binding protein
VSEPIVRLQRVTRRFGALVAVNEVDLALYPGECVGLVGHNGAGKTSIIKLMLGLLRPSAGRVSVLGQDPAAGAGVRARRELGYLPENVALYPALTGEETLAFYARLKGVDPAGNAALLARVGLVEAAKRRVGTYSKGMRQRLGLAQALLGRPHALLLDEPTSGLDPALRQSFYALVRDVREAGAAVLLSSHALAELDGVVDRVVVMNRGRKIADGDIHELRGLAGIRPRLRVRLANGAPACTRSRFAGWQEQANGILELECTEREILDRLRSLPDTAQAVEVVRPTLDDVYACFLRREEMAA